MTYLRRRAPKKHEKKMGMDFENRGTAKYNQRVRFAKDAARRQIASGAIKTMPGDMVTEEDLTAALAEFKERNSVDAHGEKQITIKRKWLEQLRKEAKEMNREYFFLPFRFKGDHTEYVTMEYDVLLSYVQTIQMLVQQINFLKKKLK